MIIKKNEIKRILIIKLRGIGDVILSTVVLDNLKHDFPEAAIDLLADRSCVEAVSQNQYFHNKIIFNRGNTLQRLKQIAAIKKNRYDLVLDFYSNPGTALITFFSGAKYRAGFPYRGRKFAYNLFGPSERNGIHAAQLHLLFLKSIGLSV